MRRFKYFFRAFFYSLDSGTINYLGNRLLIVLRLFFFFLLSIYILRYSILLAFIPFVFSLFFLYKLLFEVRATDIKRGKITDMRITGNSHDIVFKPIEKNLYILVVIIHKYEYKDIYKSSEAQEENGKFTWKNVCIGTKVEKQQDRKVMSFDNYKLTIFKVLILTYYFLREKNNSVFNMKYIRFHLERINMPFYRRFTVLPIYQPTAPETLHPTLIERPE